MWPHGCCYTYSLFQNTYCLLTYTSKLRISSRICNFSFFFSLFFKNLLLITSQKSNFGLKHFILSFAAAAQHVWKYGCLPHTNHMTPLWHKSTRQTGFQSTLLSNIWPVQTTLPSTSEHILLLKTTHSDMGHESVASRAGCGGSGVLEITRPLFYKSSAHSSDGEPSPLFYVRPDNMKAA